MKADYIDREELLKAIYIENLKEQNPNAETKSIITLIKEAPSVEQEERIEINANEIVAELMEQYDFSKSIDKDSANYLKGFAEGQKAIQKHGHWIKDSDGDVSCSVCRHYLYSKTIREASHSKDIPIVQEHTPYCPYCMAKMDKVTK